MINCKMVGTPRAGAPIEALLRAQDLKGHPGVPFYHPLQLPLPTRQASEVANSEAVGGWCMRCVGSEEGWRVRRVAGGLKGIPVTCHCLLDAEW